VKDAVGDPIEGVLVKVYNPAGDVFFTQATTDSNGLAGLTLETLEYSLRFYKFQAGFTQPQLIEVLEAPETNVFDIVGEPFVLPVATDPRFCRCSGYFRDLAGGPMQYLDMNFMSEFEPVIVDDAMISGNSVSIRTDENGYAQIDLIRGGIYYVRIEAIGGDAMRCVRVPDLASTNLPDLLFPVVERVTFDPAGPFAVAVGGELVVTPTVYDSAGWPLVGAALADVLWGSGDESVMAVVATETELTLRGIAAGTANLTAFRVDSSIIRIPDTAIGGAPQEVTVS
jgi:hypothetical protein